jgi:hypothetical protein
MSNSNQRNQNSPIPLSAMAFRTSLVPMHGAVRFLPMGLLTQELNNLRDAYVADMLMAALSDWQIGRVLTNEPLTS